VLARRVKQLSHGTRQKLGIVMALQHDPELWILDEPTTALDPLAQEGFRRVVREAASRGRAILLSSHVLAEVDAVADTVGIIRAGELVAVESIAALRSRAVRRMTVRFEGAAPPDLARVAGVGRVTIDRDGRTAALEVRGDVNALLRRLAAETVETMAFPEAELTDIFLGFYGPAGVPAGRRAADA